MSKKYSINNNLVKIVTQDVDDLIDLQVIGIHLFILYRNYSSKINLSK